MNQPQRKIYYAACSGVIWFVVVLVVYHNYLAFVSFIGVVAGLLIYGHHLGARFKVRPAAPPQLEEEP